MENKFVVWVRQNAALSLGLGLVALVVVAALFAA